MKKAMKTTWLLSLTFLTGALASSAATVTVKWTGGGDGSKWSDTSNWENGASVDFTASNVYDLSAATSGATLVNDTATKIGGFVLGESQGTVTLSSSVTATQMSGKWTIPASTTFVLQQAYSGKWADYNKTTVTGGGTVRLESSAFAPQYPWTVTNKTTVVLAKGFSGMNFIQMALADGSALKVEANGTTLGELDVDETSRVELGTNTLTLCGGLVSSYAKRGTIRGAVSGAGSIVLSGSKTVPVAASFPDFTGSLSLRNASLAFGSGCLFGAGVGLEETSSGILTLGGSQSFRAFSGTGTSGGLRVPAGAVATVWASSLDGRPLAQSRRILLTHLTDVQADGNVYAEPERRTILRFGKPRPVVRNGRAAVRLSLDAPEGYEVWALETNGRRAERVPCEIRDGRLCFTADVNGAGGARMLYEIAKGNDE